MLRPVEWLIISFFLYVALVATIVPITGAPVWMPFLLVAISALIFFSCAFGERFAKETFSIARDWVALAFVLVAYREMDWFTPATRDRHLENAWIVWDRVLLDQWGVRGMIESLGITLPLYLELCYTVVYAVGPFSVAALYILRQRRPAVDTLLFCYAAGTLLVYALFPYFPSDPPRVVFSGLDLPSVLTPVRQFNLWLVGGYGIHSSVFPSAHVSSAFSAALAMRMVVPERRRLWVGMLIYAISVAVATVYGRYHYLVDALAGIGMSIVAVWLTRVIFTAPWKRVR